MLPHQILEAILVTSARHLKIRCFHANICMCVECWWHGMLVDLYYTKVKNINVEVIWWILLPPRSCFPTSLGSAGQFIKFNAQEVEIQWANGKRNIRNEYCFLFFFSYLAVVGDGSWWMVRWFRCNIVLAPRTPLVSKYGRTIIPTSQQTSKHHHCKSQLLQRALRSFFKDLLSRIYHFL